MQEEKTYYISDASKKVQVESHVLRYWEDELKLPVKRNEMGHRYYTAQDIKTFQEIKQLKEQGLQLKAIRLLLEDGKIIPLRNMEEGIGGNIVRNREREAQRTIETENETISIGKLKPVTQGMLGRQLQDEANHSLQDKNVKLQYYLKNLIMEVMQDNNQLLVKGLSEAMVKELDYQFRLQEEREEQRENRQILLEEEHYKQLDELLRGHRPKVKKRNTKMDIVSRLKKK